MSGDSGKPWSAPESDPVGDILRIARSGKVWSQRDCDRHHILGMLIGNLINETFTVTDEASLQADIWKRLEIIGTFEREYRLTEHDRPDFWSDGIAVEVKVKGSKSDLLRQIIRYADHERVHTVVVLSTKGSLIAGLPLELRGKPLLGMRLKTGY